MMQLVRVEPPDAKSPSPPPMAAWFPVIVQLSMIAEQSGLFEGASVRGGLIVDDKAQLVILGEPPVSKMAPPSRLFRVVRRWLLLKRQSVMVGEESWLHNSAAIDPEIASKGAI